MKEIKFEEAIQKLEEIAKELESGTLGLDESVEKFEEGMKLSKTCTKMLNEAEKRINILINNGEEIQEENFVPEE
jgi:exodeoxyribonuclease VII small subunit